MHSSTLIRSLVHGKAFIGGTFAERPNAESFAVYSPRTNKRIGTFPKCGNVEASLAIEEAQKAFQSFQWTTCQQRSSMLASWAQAMHAKKTHLAKLIHLESGKPISEAKSEVDSCIEYFQWFSAEAMRQFGETIPSPCPHANHWTVRVPLGVAGIITPWNFPVAMMARKIAAALAAGCTVVAKPSEVTPLSAAAMVALSQEAKVPPGVVNLVAGDAAAIGGAICGSPIVQKVSFTGSVEVGRFIQKQSAGKRTSMELGGNAPFVVFDDASLDDAVRVLIAAKFRNCGQTCVSPNRVLVHESVEKEFTVKLVAAVKRVTFRKTAKSSCEIGPLISDAHQRKVRFLTSLAVKKGGKKVFQASSIPKRGFYFPPTVLSNIKETNPVWHEEVFGPVIFLTSFRDEAHAVHLANKTDYGLAAYVFTESGRRASRMARSLQFGMIGINASRISNAMVPFGGCKASGFGKEGGKQGIDEYTQIKLCTARAL